MQAALAFEAEEARFFLGQVRCQWPGGLDVADGHIAFEPEGVIGQIVCSQVLMDIFVGPVIDRVDFDDPVLQRQCFE